VPADAGDPPIDPPPPPNGWPAGFGAEDAERRAILTLSGLQGLKPLDVHRVAWETGSAASCVEAVRAGRLGSAGDREWLDRLDPAATAAAVTRVGARLVTPADREYEQGLHDLRDPPAALFVLGRALADGIDRVAIVGARRCSTLGRDVAEDLAAAVASAGLGVVSGAAHGIDAAAHCGTLDAGGRTVAVLGSGIDVPYPGGNRQLLRRIAEHGTIVSEYPPGVAAEAWRFPARNRIVVALARALVVVEGAARSGSRISVDHALDLGREVYAVPGPVNSALAETPLEMIREGATMIRGSDDLLDDLGLDASSPPPPPPDLDRDERVVWRSLGRASLPDAIAHEAGLSIPDAVTTLLGLELRGLIASEGGRYRLRHRRSTATAGPAAGDRR
jgi:DNA processing protein